MAWPPTEQDLLEAYAPIPWRGLPMFSPELCKPLVDKGWLRSVEGFVGEPEIVCHTHKITEKGLQVLVGMLLEDRERLRTFAQLVYDCGPDEILRAQMAAEDVLRANDRHIYRGSGKDIGQYQEDKIR